MDDGLLTYYNRELNYMRKSGAEFSEKHPKIAGRLRIDKDIVEDPHVSRLIESFSFLTARIRQSLDDSFPELTESLMGVLYPDYHSPIPSFSIAEFSLLPHLQQKVAVEQGKRLQLNDDSSSHCYYQTCSNVDVLPATIDSIRFSSLPVKAPALPQQIQNKQIIQSVLKVKISPSEQSESFGFTQDGLQFYINAQPSLAFKLHQLLLNNAIGIAFAENAFDPSPIFVSASSIKPVGFSEDERMLLPGGRTSLSHSLLIEYFLMPQKFLFFNIEQMTAVWDKYPAGFEVFIYFDSQDVDLEKGLGDRNLLLGCVPIVNLFGASSKPLQASEIVHEMILRPGHHEAQYADVYQIKEVYAINSSGEKVIIPPFYGSHINGSKDGIYWSQRREDSTWQKGNASHGTDTYITFVDSNYEIISPDSHWIINADLVCMNRDQPNKLQFGPDQPVVNLLEGGAGLKINCLTPPTPTVLPRLDNSTRWQLVSQLSLQHFSGPNGLQQLKEMLTLYNFNDSKEIIRLIEGLVDLSAEVTTARLLDKGKSTMCQGTHFLLTCDESYYSGHGLYLFGMLLDEFLSQLCSINTFVQVSIKTTKYSRVEFSWPPRVGCQSLI